MPRAINGTVKRKRHNRLRKECRGYVMGRKLHRMMMEARKRALQFAFRDRKVRKREFRRLWIARISAACRLNGTRYARFIEGLKALNVEMNRKMLSELAIHDPQAFTDLVEQATKAVPTEGKPAGSAATAS